MKAADNGSATVVLDAKSMFWKQKRNWRIKNTNDREMPSFVTAVPIFSTILAEIEEENFWVEQHVEYLSARIESRPHQLYLLHKVIKVLALHMLL